MNDLSDDTDMEKFVREHKIVDKAEFHFVWIDKSPCFVKQPFNLSGRFIFELNSEATVLTITDNPRFIEGFWGKQNIRNVTALVGQNGSGKSLFLEYMLDTFPQFSLVPKPKDRKLIAAIERDGRFSIVYNHVAADIFTVKDETAGKLWHGSGLFFDPDFKTGSMFARHFHDLNFVYYSSEFNTGHFRRQEVGRGPAAKIHDISTRHLVQNDAELYSNRPSSLPQLLMAHANMETLRNVDFFLQCNNAKDLLRFTLPSMLWISPVNYTEDEKYEFLGSDNKDFVLSTRGVGKERFLDEFAIASLLNYFKDSTPTNAGKVFQDVRKENHASTFDTVQEFFKRASSSLNHNNASVRVELLSYCESNEFDKSCFDNTGSILNFHLHQPGMSDKLNKFYDLYTRSVIITPYIDEKWDRRVSSGQQSLWNLYSRFWCYRDGRPMLQNDRKVDGPMIVLVDEADQYFHPKLQKELVDRLLEFLAGAVFPTNSIQIILTSNSPFCLSDIPRDHMILLKADQNGKCKVLSRLDKMSQTLGASIPDLLADEFFMGYSTMGDFARKQIQSLTRWIKGGDSMEAKDLWFTAASAWKVIQIVGEPLLQRKLIEAYRAAANERNNQEMLKLCAECEEGSAP